MTEPFIIYALKVDQPIGEFYIGSVSAEELDKISYVDVREFQKGKADSIAGIQRKLSKSRVKDINKYVNYDYASFPTSIVVAVDERCADIVPSEKTFGLYKITISPFEDTEEPSNSIPIGRAAKILDGQHRLAGLQTHNGKKQFDLNLSMFIGIDIDDQAEIFSTVNQAQTKVNKSLVLDLYDYQKSKSTYRSAHYVAVSLDADSASPLHEKIKRIGIAHPERDKNSETLSQATVVRGLLRHYPGDPEEEKNKGKREQSNVPLRNESWKNTIFCEFYRADDTSSIYKIVKNYFDAVAKKWPSVWYDNHATFILNRTNGYNALIRFLRDCYLHALANEETTRVVPQAEFFLIFEKIDLKAADFHSDNYKPGSSGSAQLYKDLVKSAPF